MFLANNGEGDVSLLKSRQKNMIDVDAKLVTSIDTVIIAMLGTVQVWV